MITRANFLKANAMAFLLRFSRSSFISRAMTGSLTLAQLQQRTDALSQAGGGTIALGPGVVNLTGTYIPRTGVSLVGSGAATILRMANGVNAHAIANDDSISDVTLAYLTVDGNKANNSAGGHNIRLGHGFTGVRLVNVRSHDASLHGVITKDDGPYNMDLTIVNLISDGNGVSANGSGLYLNSTIDAQIVNYQGIANTLDGYQWKGGGRITATNLLCLNNARFGMFFTDGGSGEVQNFDVQGSSLGVMIQRGNSTATTMLLANGQVEGCRGDGVQLDGVQDCAVRGVRSHYNTEAGLRLVNGAQYNRITDCALTECKYGLLGANGTAPPDHNVITSVLTRGNAVSGFQRDSWGTSNLVTALAEF